MLKKDKNNSIFSEIFLKNQINIFRYSVIKMNLYQVKIKIFFLIIKET